jgi:hypothetical protein
VFTVSSAFYAMVATQPFPKISRTFPGLSSVWTHFSRTCFLDISMCTTKISTVQYNINGYNFEKMYLPNIYTNATFFTGVQNCSCQVKQVFTPVKSDHKLQTECGTQEK